MRTQLDVCIFLLQQAHIIVDWHGARAGEQMLINAIHAYPDMPWKIAIQGLLESDERFMWAKRAFDSHTLLNDGRAA